MVSSVTEGEDKPLKYPLMFRACELVVVNKIDLLPHLDFDLDRYLANLDAVHPGVDRTARQRAHRRGGRRRGATGSSRGPTGGPCRRDSTALARDAKPTRASSTAEAERHRRAVPAAGRALRARRPAARRRRLAAGLVGRAPRRGRVRPPGDRRQAGAAGARARAPDAARACSREPDDTVIAFGLRPRRRRLPPIGFAPGAEWTFEPPADDPFVRQELVETAYHVLWELGARLLRPPRRSSAPGRAASELPLPVPRARRARPRRRARRRARARC